MGVTGRALGIVLVAGMTAAGLAAQTVARVVAGPLPTPENIAALETRVLENPEDLDARGELLQFYANATVAGHEDPVRQTVRLQHILYLVQRHPEAAVSGSKAAYVYGAGPYADAADHEAVRRAWRDAVEAHPKVWAVSMNAVRFLEVEDERDAEDVLKRAVRAEPENREIRANLGFFYARQIKGGREPLAAATQELEQSSDPVVLAAASTALANLAKNQFSVNRNMIDLSDHLAARARQLAPDDSDVQSLMPFVQYFAATQQTPPAVESPQRIRVGENVQAANLIQKTPPEYPEAARNAGIAGDVRFSILIGRDGVIQNVRLVSGHPLLVEAARQAVETWRYKPALLNGSPVEVETTVTVTFRPN
jgi:TonB family protein